MAKRPAMRKRKKSRPSRARLDDKLQVLRGPSAKRYPLLGVDKDGDVGFNLTCVRYTVIMPGADLPPTELPVDLRVKLPKGTSAMIWPRSGTAIKYPGLLLCQAPIDNGYTGPIGPRFKNLGTEPVVVEAGAALAQLVLYSSVVPEVVEVDELPETERGETRFGSTGR